MAATALKFPVILFSLMCLIHIHANGQDSVLEQYIREGLENNLTLRQRQDSIQLKVADLKAAKGMFLPDVSLNARYTVASGGRTIDFPVGDLLNPIYQNLNVLDQHLALPVGPFPEDVPNMEFYFYRPYEQETKLQLIQPIISPQLIFNRRIRSKLLNAELSNTQAYKRILVAEVKAAYYNYMKTIEVNTVLDNTRKLLEENIRVNESLFKNNKVTIDNVYRSKAELSKLEKNKAVAVKQQKMASAYFNFLLNRPFGTPIVTEKDSMEILPVATLDAAIDEALTNREELTVLKQYESAATDATKLTRSNKYPSVLAAVNYGIQGEKYSFTANDDFVLASVVLQWNLFKGFQNDAKIQKSKIKEDILKNKYDEVSLQIKLQVTEAWYGLEAAGKAIDASAEQLQSAKKGYEIVERKYSEGQANLLEYIDARNNYTTASVNLIMAHYDYRIQYAEYEQVTGLYQF